MRILYWTASFWPHTGGVEVLGSKYLREMRRRGHEAVVVCSHGDRALPDEDEHEGVRIHRFPFREVLERRDPARMILAQRRLEAVKRGFEPDVVHVQLTDASVWFHLRTRHVRPAPWVVTLAVSPTSGAAADTVLGRTLREADWVIALTDAGLEGVRALVPEVLSRSSVIRNGLELPEARPSPLPFDPPRALCLGRVVDVKGFDLAIRAWPAVLATHPGARLTVAGEGPARDGLRRLAEDLGVASAVDFPGWIDPDRVPALVDRAAVVVVPSRWEEAFGLVALEGMQMGRPVVATKVGGLPEVVRDGRTGILVPREDVRALAAAVIDLFSDPDRARTLGAAGRERAATEFTLQRYVDDHEALYEERRREFHAAVRR